MQNTNIHTSQYTFFISIYGLFWFIGGMLYTYVGNYVVFPLTTYPSEPITAIQNFFNLASSFSFLYFIIFTLFTLADLSLSLIGIIFYSLLQPSFKLTVAMFCLLIGGIFGTIVDIVLLSFWHIIVASKAIDNNFLSFLWSLLGFIEYFTIWLSAAGFLIGSLGFYFLYLSAKESQKFSKLWLEVTLLNSIFSALAVLAIIWNMFGGNQLWIGALFFIATVLLIPLWSFLTIKQLHSFPTT